MEGLIANVEQARVKMAAADDAFRAACIAAAGEKRAVKMRYERFSKQPPAVQAARDAYVSACGAYQDALRRAGAIS